MATPNHPKQGFHCIENSGFAEIQPGSRFVRDRNLRVKGAQISKKSCAGTVMTANDHCHAVSRPSVFSAEESDGVGELGQQEKSRLADCPQARPPSAPRVEEQSVVEFPGFQGVLLTRCSTPALPVCASRATVLMVLFQEPSKVHLVRMLYDNIGIVQHLPAIEHPAEAEFTILACCRLEPFVEPSQRFEGVGGE